MEQSNRGIKIYRIIMLVIITALISSVTTMVFMHNYSGNNIFAEKIEVEPAKEESDLAEYLSALRKQLDKVYLGEIKEEDLINGAIKGYINGLGDPYTEYYTPDEMKEFETSTKGNYVGIGIYMGVRTTDQAIVVISPIKGSPAEAVGIKAGDVISKVDGVEYSGDQMDIASNYIKGEEGTKVKLEIIRDDKVLNFEVERRNIDIAPVEAKILEGNIGYISLPSFDEGCSNEVKEKVKEFNEKGIDKIILDLRNNGGGLVDEALAILEIFTNKGDNLLITVDKYNSEQINKSKKSQTTNAKLIVLTNKSSASASEIVAGTLKDLNRATLVGTNTYGKGVIQVLMPVGEGAGLKVTIEEYYTANKNKINGIGIKPNVEIEDDDKTEEDEQLNKAIELLKK